MRRTIFALIATSNTNLTNSEMRGGGGASDSIMIAAR